MSRRHFGESYPYAPLDGFVLLNLIVLHVLARSHGLSLGLNALWMTIKTMAPALLASTSVAVAVRYLLAGRSSSSDYRAIIRTARWWAITLRLLAITILTSHFYLWLKLIVPLINARSFDQELWNLDRVLLLGFSPNEVLLNALGFPSVIRALDLVYVIAFFSSAVFAVPFFASMSSDRERFAYFAGNTLLWTIGVWIYVAVPSMGPAYRFPDIWANTYALFRESRHLQYELLQNYLAVTRFRESGILTPVNVVYGIAAFPSLHVGFQSFLMLWMRRYSRVAGAVLLIVVVSMFIGSIVTGWHYAIDGIAGFLLAALCYRLGRRATNPGGRPDEDGAPASSV